MVRGIALSTAVFVSLFCRCGAAPGHTAERQAKHPCPVNRSLTESPTAASIFPAAPPPIVITPGETPGAYPYTYTHPSVVSGPASALPPQTYGGGGGTVLLPSGGSFGAPPLAGGGFGGGRPTGGSFGNGHLPGGDYGGRHRY